MGVASSTIDVEILLLMMILFIYMCIAKSCLHFGIKFITTLFFYHFTMKREVGIRSFFYQHYLIAMLGKDIPQILNNINYLNIQINYTFCVLTRLCLY